MSTPPPTGRPRVLRNLRFVRQGGERPSYVVKDPVSLKYFRFGEMEAWLLGRMDGTRTFAEIADGVGAQFGVRTTAGALEAFFRRLQEMGIGERTPEERHLLLLEKTRSDRQLRLSGGGNTVLRMRFSLGDPDRFLGWVVPYLRFFWTPGFVLFSIAAFLVYGLVLAVEWRAFLDGMLTLYRPERYTLGFIATAYATGITIFFVHELGHALTCKRFGGEVHEVGLMLIYFQPAFYCNVNDAWTFESRSARLWVTFAGSWIQLVVAAAAALVWVVAEPGTVTSDVAFLAVLVGGVYSVLVNYNPLIPLDGYYALMDWLEIPNLRARSFGYLGAHLRRRLLGQDVPLPRATPRERKVFLTYGWTAALYSTLLVAAFLVWLASLAAGKLGWWGWALVAFLAWRLARRPYQRLAAPLSAWWSEPAKRPRRGKLPWLAAAPAATGLVLLLPWTVRVGGEVSLEPAERIWLRPADDGWVDTVLAEEGQGVLAGQLLASIRNPTLDLEWRRASGAVSALEREAAAAHARGDAESARFAELELVARRAHLAELDRRRAALELRSPSAGRVLTRRPHDLVGAGVARGDSLLEVWSGTELRARIRLAERDAGEVRGGASAGLRFPSNPSTTWRTRVAHVEAAARDGTVELLAPLGPVAAGAILLPGMKGRAKIAVRRTNIAGAAARALRRLVRTDFLL